MHTLARLINNPVFNELRTAYQSAVDKHATLSQRWPEEDDHGPEKVASLNELLKHQMAFGNYMQRAGVSPRAISEALQAVKPRTACFACSQDLEILRLKAEKAELTERLNHQEETLRLSVELWKQLEKDGFIHFGSAGLAAKRDRIYDRAATEIDDADG